jgi:FMN reductase
MTKITCISASLREDSCSFKALFLAHKQLNARGIETTLLNLKEMNLPFCDGSSTYPDFPDVEKIRQELSSSQALLISSPEYHGCISGVLKNFFDLLSFEHIKGKIIANISVLGGVSSNNSVNAITQICHHLHAWVLPRPLIISHASSAFNEEGKLADPDHEKRLSKLLDDLLDATENPGA